VKALVLVLDLLEVQDQDLVLPHQVHHQVDRDLDLIQEILEVPIEEKREEIAEVEVDQDLLGKLHYLIKLL